MEIPAPTSCLQTETVHLGLQLDPVHGGSNPAEAQTETQTHQPGFKPGRSSDWDLDTPWLSVNYSHTPGPLRRDIQARGLYISAPEGFSRRQNGR